MSNTGNVRFDEFWDVYPRHISKSAALAKFVKLVKDGVDPAELATGAKRYAEYARGQDPRYIKHPTTWLNQGCWEDEYPTSRLDISHVVASRHDSDWLVSADENGNLF